MSRPKRKQNLSKQTMIMHTKNPGHVCDIQWKIDNVLKFPDQTFTSKVKLGRRCRTNLNIIVRIKDGENYSDFFIGYERTDQIKVTIHVIFDIQLVNSKGDIYMHTKAKFSPATFHKVIRFMKIKFADPDYFVQAEKVREDQLGESDGDILKNLVSEGLVVWDEENVNKVYSLPGDSINVKGTVKVFACCVPLRTKPIHHSSEDVSTNVIKTELVENLESAFVSEVFDGGGQFTDVSLLIQGEEVRAHKFVLAARCPRFKRLLQPRSNGQLVRELVIEDMKKRAFLPFLQYLYTGIVGEVQWDLLQKLYEIAIEYEVDSLLQQCRKNLISGLRERRACRAMLFAKKHRDEELNKAVIDYIKVIFYEYKKSITWEVFRRDHPGLANEVMHAVVADLK